MMMVYQAVESSVGDFPSQFRGSGEESVAIWSLVRPDRDSLARLKRLSMRKGAWFAALNWEQRRLMDVVIGTVDRIRSILLLRVLAPLVIRLLTAIGGNARSGAITLMGVGAYTIMKNVAVKIVQLAQGWGNNSAVGWVDEGFLRYLVVMNLPQNRNSVILGSQ